MYSPVQDAIVRGPIFRRKRRNLKDRFLVSLFQSGRVKMFVAVAGLIAGGIALGLTPAVAMQLAIVAGSWILGESIRPSASGLLSRRFIATLAAQLAAILANVGFNVPAEDMTSILVLVVAMITGDAWREVKTKTEQIHDDSRAQLVVGKLESDELMA